MQQRIEHAEAEDVAQDALRNIFVQQIKNGQSLHRLGEPILHDDLTGERFHLLARGRGWVRQLVGITSRGEPLAHLTQDHAIGILASFGSA